MAWKSAVVCGVKPLFILFSLFFLSGAIRGLAATQTSGTEAADQKQSAEDRQRIMGGMPTRAELKTRRARATNAPVSFSINSKTERLEARDIDGALIEEYAPGAVGHLLDVGGYELKVSFGRDESRRLSLLLRPGPAQAKPVQVSVFQRRLILPSGTSVSAFMEKDGMVTIEPCLTGTIYYLDTQPTAVDLPEDKVKLLASKNLVRIGRDVEQGKIPDEEMVDAVVEGTLETEDKQTPKNNAGLAVGGWFQNAGVSLLGLPNPQTTPPATVVKVASGTPELSAPSPQNQTPNFDPSPVATGKNVPSKQVTQNVKVIALKGDLGEATIAREPFVYEEGDKKDLAKASKQGLVPRPLENPEMAPVAPAATLDQKPPGDAAGNAVVRAVRSFLGIPEAKTVQAEADKLAGKKE
jgi:hypothetical protein